MRLAPGGVDDKLEFAGTSMIRSELVQKLCSDFPDLTQREVENVVSAIFDSITDQLAAGRPRRASRLRRLLDPPARRPRRAATRAPASPVDVDAKRVPYFKPGKEMRERLNLSEVAAE